MKHKGNFNNIERFFNRILKRDYLNIVEKYGQKGVNVLRDATPVGSGKTADAWNFLIEDDGRTITLAFTNSNENDGQNIVILLMYGHGTQNGGYVEANDFVHPAIEPVFNELAEELWREVTV